jgi:hypothetical protein
VKADESEVTQCDLRCPLMSLLELNRYRFGQSPETNLVLVANDVKSQRLLAAHKAAKFRRIVDLLDEIRL